jgi:phage protein D
MSGNPSEGNNPSQKPRRGTTFQLEFPTMPSLTRIPKRVELYQKQYKQDVMVISMPITGQLWFDMIPTGLPVRFSWQQGSIGTTWYGYVSFISKNVAVQREQTMEVHCIGASFPLKERANRVFTNSSIPEAAEVIAKEHGFSFVGSPHPRKFSQLIMAGHSYWEWLVEQATRIGYAILVDGTTLHFRELDQMIDQSVSSVPLLAFGESRSLYRGQYYDRTLDEFRVLKGEHIEGSEHLRAEKYVAGVDHSTGSAVVSSSNPQTVGTALKETTNDVLFSEYRTDQVIENDTAAQDMSKGAAQMARLNMPAKVKCQGDARIRPYSTVQISGTGTLTDGYWVVKEAHHIFQKFGDYNIDMTVVTDGTGANQATNFRERQASNVSTVNIADRMINPENEKARKSQTQLTQLSPAIMPHKHGFKRSPALWNSLGR